MLEGGKERQILALMKKFYYWSFMLGSACFFPKHFTLYALWWSRKEFEKWIVVIVGIVVNTKELKYITISCNFHTLPYLEAWKFYAQKCSKFKATPPLLLWKKTEQKTVFSHVHLEFLHSVENVKLTPFIVALLINVRYDWIILHKHFISIFQWDMWGSNLAIWIVSLNVKSPNCKVS